MALLRGYEPEPEGEQQRVSLQGLAEAWEGDNTIRHRCRQRGSLLNWGGAATVGVVSM